MTTLMANSARHNRDTDIAIAGEAFEALACWLQSSTTPDSHRAKTIGLTSCQHNAGVSTIAESLAIASAQVCDSPVLLMDVSGKANARRSRLRSSSEAAGGSRYDAAPRDEQAALPTIIPNLSLLTVAPTGSALKRHVSSRRVKRLLAEKELEFGLIVLDLPPIDSGVCFAIGGVLGGMILVVEAGGTNGEVAAGAKKRLQQANADVLGVILNKYSGDTAG